MNWDDIRVFLAVSRAGSLSAAAKKLGVTQPTVGRRLKALEDNLRARLFDRLPDGLVPSPAGAELLPLAEAMESRAMALERRTPALAEGAKGSVRISVWETFAQLLTGYMADMRGRLPEIEIELGVNHINANLSRREADLIVQECVPENPSLIVRRLGAYTFAVYGARDYVAAHPQALGESRYQTCEWVGFDEDHTYFHNQTWLLEQLDGRQPAVRTNNGIVIYEAVREGAGLGVLPCFAGDADETLVRLTPPIDDLEHGLHLVVHPDVRRSPAVRAVMDVMAEIFKGEADRLLGRDRAAIRATIAEKPAAAQDVA